MGLLLSTFSRDKRGARNRQQPIQPKMQAGSTFDSRMLPPEIQNLSTAFSHPYQDPNARDDRLSFPLDGMHLSSTSDQQLREIFLTAPKLHEYAGVLIVRLSKTLVIKGGNAVAPSESRTMIFAAESLHLPVPKVHRTLTARVPGLTQNELVEGHLIVMDFIPGPTVEECWESLDASRRESVAAQVAAMVNTMQATPLDLPSGPIGGTGGQKFEGPWFTDDGAGPFTTMKDLEDWLNHKIDVCVRFKQLSRRAPRFRFQKQVLTHQDISPRNLILDAQGKVWMIDWGVAGVYPVGFEQAVIRVQSKRNTEFADMVLARLSDRQESVAEQYHMIGYGLSVAASL